MTTPSYFKNNLRLSKERFTKSIFKFNTNYHEHAPIELVQSFVKNKQGISLKSNRLLNKSYDNENKQMELYLKKYDKKNDVFNVKYSLPAHKWGRVSPEKSLSLCVFHRPTRHAYCKGIYIDIDVKNCHPVVIKNICQLNDIPCPTITSYCDDRDGFLQRVCDHHEVNSAEAKNLILRLTYGGEYNRWLDSLLLKQQTPRDAMAEILQYESEMEDIRNEVFEKNTHIIADVEKADPLKFKNPKYKTPEDVLRKKKKTCMSLFCGTIERHLQESCIKFLVDNKDFDLLDIVPCQDGFMIKFDLWYDDIMKELEQVMFDKIGFDIELKVKEFDEACDIPVTAEEVKEDDDESQTEAKVEEEWKAKFRQIVPEFEKNHCKIVNKSLYVKTTPNGITFLSKSQLVHANEHIQCGFHMGGPVCFIDKWVRFNDKINKRDDMDFYPPPLICPDNVFNLWRPFDMELLTDSYPKHQEGLDFILNHIKILCGNDQVVFDYVIKWIAQMIQFPAIKTVVLVFISKQGAGKGTLLKLFRLMLGVCKVFETTSPSRDVWGDFNGMMASSFLVNLNEMSKKEMGDCEGRFKALATDPTLTINNKGVNQFKIQSHHRFIITTNKEDPIKTTDDDRRLIIIRSSDEKIGDKDYFNKINEYLDDINVVRSCYDYFKSIEGMDKFGSLPKPQTEYQNNLKQLSRSPIDMWLEDFTRRHSVLGVDKVERLGIETFADFEDWRRTNNITYETDVRKLGVALSNISINDGIARGRHTKKGETKLFNIQVLKGHFNIGVMIDSNNNTPTKKEDGNESQTDCELVEVSNGNICDSVRVRR